MSEEPEWLIVVQHPLLFFYIFMYFKVMEMIELHNMRKELPKVKE